MTERRRNTSKKSIFCSAISSRGNNLAQKKENEKSFYSLILLEQRFPLKIFLAKYVRILVKSVQLGYSSGNLSESFRIYQRLGARKQKIQGIVSFLQRNCGRPDRPEDLEIFCHTSRAISFRISYLLC